jgi:hypothetical protein
MRRLIHWLRRMDVERKVPIVVVVKLRSLTVLLVPNAESIWGVPRCVPESTPLHLLEHVLLLTIGIDGHVVWK